MTDVKAIIYLQPPSWLTGREARQTWMPRREAELQSLAEEIGWTVDQVVVEHGRTAGADGWRVGFRSVLEECRTGRANGLLVEQPARITQALTMFNEFMMLAELHQLHVRSLCGSLTLTAGGTPAERAMAGLLLAAGEVTRATERRMRAARVGKVRA